MSTRQEREASLHDKFFSKGTRQRLEAIYGGKRRSRTFYGQWLDENAPGRRVLEYGCGQGELAVDLAKKGAVVSGIDISPEAVRQASRRAREAGVEADFHVMDAHALTFPDQSFDIVFGSAILHHLDLRRSAEEISRVLRPGGTAIFLEPLGHNPFIEAFRKITPKLRTPDERPLLVNDVKMLESFYEKCETRYFHLVSLATLPLTTIPFLRPVNRAFELVDEYLFRRVQASRKYAWTAVLVLSRPLSGMPA